MIYSANLRFLNRNILATLCLVTAFAFLLIYSFARPVRVVGPLVRDADAATLIYRLDTDSSNLASLLATQRGPLREPIDSSSSLELALVALSRYRASGNTRFLGVAKATLARWWEQAEPPPGIWLLRGRILQTEHQFVKAAQDLSRLNRRYASNVEALLLETDSWRRAGKIGSAKRACLTLAFAGRLDLAQFCSAEILMSVGQPERAHALLETAINMADDQPQAERAWAHSIYADSLAARGEFDKANDLWVTILQAQGDNLSYRLAYADLLLMQSEWPAVVSLLAENAQSTAALLRLCIAARKTDSADYPRLLETLRQRFDIVERSTSAHLYLRDRALFALLIEDDSDRALGLALQNWRLQKGWEDGELVLRAALAAGDNQAARRVEDWRQAAAAGIAQ